MINLHIIVVSCTIKESYYGSLQYRTARLLLGLFNNSNSVYHSGHYMGHMAVLIGDDEHGWYFISKEGRDKSDNAPRYSNEITGGPSYTYWKWFPSKADFDNKRNQFEKTKGYDKEIRYKSDLNQDIIATSIALMSAGTKYHFLFSNCADVASDALFSIGLDLGYTSAHSLDPRPNERFEQIVKNNNNHNNNTHKNMPSTKTKSPFLLIETSDDSKGSGDDSKGSGDDSSVGKTHYHPIFY